LRKYEAFSLHIFPYDDAWTRGELFLM
jgi:hypothetical protein